MASPKQVNYLMALLKQCGFDTKSMNSSYKSLGATMKERSGSVEDWIKKMNTADASRLIDHLKSQANERKQK